MRSRSPFRAPDYDDTDAPHHPKCPANPDDNNAECDCLERAEDAYDRAMDARIDRERGK